MVTNPQAHPPTCLLKLFLPRGVKFCLSQEANAHSVITDSPPNTHSGSTQEIKGGANGATRMWEDVDAYKGI